MLKRKNDRQPQSMEELYPDDYWLDEEDGEELPVPEMKRKPVSGRLHDEPMVTGYEALERQRGVRRPNRKLTRREKKALKRAQKYEEKLHKEHEKADKKNAKREAKLAARAEKQAVRDAKKNAKKKKSRPAAAPPGQRPAGKAVSGTRSSGTGKKTPDSARDKRITAQQSIPYHEMGRDGICRVQDKFYSKTIRFYDINYQLAQNEDKNTIFENWCDFLNYFDSTIHFQLSFINQHSNMAEYEKVIHINPQEDEFDDLRMEFAQMLNNQLAKGNNGLVRTKYITFGIEAENIREARPKLERIESDILNNFKILGVSAYPLNGEERLQIMYETFNQDSKVPFHFSYDDVLRTGLSTKDYVAPTSFVFKNGKDFEMGGTMGAVSYLQILAPELTDKMLAEFLEMDSNLMVNFHIQSIDQMKAIKLVKSKVTDINRMKIEEQKKAVRAGYDMDIIPSDLNTYGGEAKRLLEDLQSRNERMFLVVSENIANEEAADLLASLCMDSEAVITQVKREQKKAFPPKLYDLTSLQREANRYFGYTAKKTLDMLQELYEEKLVTYPRTDSQFVTEDMRDTVEELLGKMPVLLPFLDYGQLGHNITRVINNAKVSDHHAILPTKEAVEKGISDLTADKKNLMMLVCQQLVQATGEEYQYEQTDITVKCQGHDFTARGKVPVQMGFKAAGNAFKNQCVKAKPEEETEKETSIPYGYEEGMTLSPVKAEKTVHFTSPPKPFNEDTLLAAMETAGNKDFDSETEKKGLGTPATRAGIIEKLVSSGYAVRKGKQILPSTEGRELVNVMPAYLKSAAMTAEWENQLLMMEKGQITDTQFMGEITSLVGKILSVCREIPETERRRFQKAREVIGKCPVCGSDVYEGKQNFYCSNRQCDFALWKENRFLGSMEKTLDKKMAVELLDKACTHVKGLYSRKKDIKFDADLLLTLEDGKPRFHLEFPKKK